MLTKLKGSKFLNNDKGRTIVIPTTASISTRRVGVDGRELAAHDSEVITPGARSPTMTKKAEQQPRLRLIELRIGEMNEW